MFLCSLKMAILMQNLHISKDYSKTKSEDISDFMCLVLWWIRACGTGVVEPLFSQTWTIINLLFECLVRPGTAGQLSSAKNIGARLTPGIPTCKQFSCLFLMSEGKTSTPPPPKNKECHGKRCSCVSLVVSTVRPKLLHMSSASHVLCAYSVSSLWNQWNPFPQLYVEVRSSATLGRCS